MLVVGLGNPGPGYQGTRHNVGEEVVRSLAAARGASFKRAPRCIRARIAGLAIGGRATVLALPTSYMNQSGGPVSGLVKYYKPEHLLVVHDDIDLPFRKLRLHYGRGSGGHNGVASIVRALGSSDMFRLKFGVGRPPGRMDPAEFVLRPFTKKERPDVDLLVTAAADVVCTFLEEGEEAARQSAGETSARLFGEQA